MRTVFLLACGFAAACTASASEVRPPADQIFFPTGMAVAPGDAYLFVASANSELRYDSGSISVIELDRVEQIANDWVNTGNAADCSPDADHRETLNCDASEFIRLRAGVRIGNFATDIGVQDFGANNLRLIVPTRGDPSIAWANYDGTNLSCTASSEGYGLCDDAHRLSYLHNDPNLPGIPDEPFGVYADSTNGFAMVTHLTTGAVTLVDSQPNNDLVEVADVLNGVFAPDASGIRGATGIVGRSPASANNIIYVASRSENRIQTFTVGRPVNGAAPYLLAGNYFFLNGFGGSSGDSSDNRGLAFSPDGNRLYLVSRRAPALELFDTSLDPSGFPRNKLVAATDICREASTISVLDSGAGERAYVTCFQDGQLYVIDPRDGVQVEDVVTVGRGPYSVIAAKTRKKLYVSNFLEDTIAVIDVTPGVPTHNRVVLRIGKPKQ